MAAFFAANEVALAVLGVEFAPREVALVIREVALATREVTLASRAVVDTSRGVADTSRRVADCARSHHARGKLQQTTREGTDPSHARPTFGRKERVPPCA
jgi:hypothetical protein